MRPSTVEPDLSNAAPFLAAALVDRRPGHGARLAAARRQAGDALRDLLAALGRTASRSTRRAASTVDAAPARLARHRRSTCTTSASSPRCVAALAALADRPHDLRGIAHLRGHETDRLAALAREIDALGGDVDRDRRRAASSARRRCTAASFETYDDHRLATAGAVLGLAVPGVQVVDVATTGKTLPGFVDLWLGDARPAERRPREQRGGATSTRTTSGSARAGASPGPAPRTGPRTTTPSAAWSSTVDRGRFTCVVGPDGEPASSRHGHEGPRARPQGRRRRRPGALWSATLGGADGAGPDRAGRAAHDRAAPHAPTTPTRSSGSSSPTPTSSSSSPRWPTPSRAPRLIDRCLVAAYDAGLDPLLCSPRPTSPPPTRCWRPTARSDVPYVATAARRRRSTRCSTGCADRRQVLVGHSGVGKSTLVNALVPDADRAIGRVNAVTGRGRHTSTSAWSLELPGGGWVIDTPGIRSFGLAHVDPARVIQRVPRPRRRAPRTARAAARHDEPECALDAWVADGHADAGAAGLAAPAAARRATCRTTD